MRINAFVARATGLSRRAADAAIEERRVELNGRPATLGQTTEPNDTVTLDGRPLTVVTATTTIMFNKPAGYVCSRQGQGSPTVYDLLPAEYRRLKPVGRLDKDTSGLLLLTDDGQLANNLTHPRYNKEKVYKVSLNKPLRPEDKAKVERGVKLSDGISKIRIKDLDGQDFTASLSEGRNRQIRRTFAALGYQIEQLHRTNFGDYALGDLSSGKSQII